VAYHSWCLTMNLDGFLNRKHTLGVLNFHHSMTHLEPPTPLSSSEVTRVGASGGLDSSLPWDVIVGDVPLAPGYLDVTVLGDWELGMPSFPRMPSLSADWGQVKRGAELACSQVVSTC
jgi:hypothetical protein